MRKCLQGFYGFFLLFVAGCLIAPLLVALAYREKACVYAFIISIIISAIPGALIRLTSGAVFRDSSLKLRYSYFIVTSAWILASLI